MVKQGYVQYTHARACSVIKKSEIENIDLNIDFSKVTDKASVEVCKLIEAYPDKIIDASKKYEPYIITRHLVDISQAFNKFYHDNPILNSDAETKKARLAIVNAVKSTLKNGLSILGIDAPEQM